MARLVANKQRHGEEIDLDGPPRRYLLCGMRPATSYEVRISHSAATPAEFKMLVLQPGRSDAGLRRFSRRLLDTDKITIHPGKGRYSQLATPPHMQRPRANASSVVTFNIVLEELAFSMPLDAIPVGLITLIALAAFLWVGFTLADLQQNYPPGDSTTAEPKNL